MNEVIENSIFDEYYFKPYLAWVQTHIDTNYDLISRQLSHICTVKSEAAPKLASDLENLQIFTFNVTLVPALRNLKNADLFTNKILEKINVSSTKEQLKESIIICRSFKQVDKAKLTSLLDKVFHKIVDENLEDKLEVLPEIITALFALHSSAKVASMINLEKCANLFVKNPANVYVLQMFDFMLLLHLLQDSADLGGTDKEKVFTALGDHLGSWEPVAREIAVHALTLVIPLLGKIVIVLEKDFASEQNYFASLSLLLLNREVYFCRNLSLYIRFFGSWNENEVAGFFVFSQ